jgi:hypothetical protein
MTYKSNYLDTKIQELREIPGLYEFVLKNCFIAGGAVRDAIRDVKPKDYDIFFRTEEAKEEFIQIFSKRFTETSIGNFNYKDFQFITLYTGTPQQVVDTFDWNVNQEYYEFGKNNPKYLSRIREKYLTLNTNCRKPLSAFLRLPDMLKKGYEIEKEELLYVLSFISQVSAVRGDVDLSKEFEFVSSGGGFIGSDKAERAVKRATQEAVKHSPLYKVMK